MVSGIFYVLRTAIPWRDLPAAFGPGSSVYTRFRRWCASGLFAQMLALVARGAESELRHIDCSHIKLHQDGTNPPGCQSNQAIGRTKGGINTKLAAVVDGYRRAVALGLAAGQRHHLYAVEPLLPCLRGNRAVADKRFDADSSRARLCRQRTRLAPSDRPYWEYLRFAESRRFWKKPSLPEFRGILDAANARFPENPIPFQGSRTLLGAAGRLRRRGPSLSSRHRARLA